MPTRTKEQPGTGSFGFRLHRGAMPQIFIPKSLLKRIGLPGVLTQACRRDKPQSETERPANTRDNQMERGKGKNISNRNQGYLASSEPSSPMTASPGYPNTPEKQDFDLKSHLMMMIEDVKKDCRMCSRR